MSGRRQYEEDFDNAADEIKIEGGESSGAADKKAKKERVNTTVFVSSLPYETTTTDLITHFSFVGPVKNGFVVKDRDSGESKGVGYITYTEVEDAEKAVAELNNGAFGVSTRKIRVSLADIKPTRLERSHKTIPALMENDVDMDIPDLPGQSSSAAARPTRTKPVQPRGQPAKKSGDANAIRTLVLTGIPADVDKNTLWKRVRKVAGIEEGKNEALHFPVDVVAGEETKETLGQTANIVFTSHSKAVEAIPMLHAHTYKGALLSCVLKKRIESAGGGASGDASGKANRAGRLIVRNLAWNTTEMDLRKRFLPFGPILGINLPTTASKLPHKDLTKPPPPPRARGFAFVWFLSKKDAEAAIEKMNDAEVNERKITVDWAVSKDKYEEAKKEEGGDDKEAVEAVLGDDKKDGSEDADGEDEEAEGATGEDDDEVAEKMEADEEEAKPVKPVLPDVEEGSTLFVRNVPFEVTEEELRNLFRTFGPLRYAKITMDRATGRSRGTGFACFWKREDADKVLEEANRVHEITGANMIGLTPKNPFAMPSVLQIDPSASTAEKLVLHGRTLEVVRALTREDAALKKEDGEKSRQKADKRNTYLMREGVIFPNTPAAQLLPEIEVEKRSTSFSSRRKLLESNPALYISKTRLSIRQIPLYATDRTLKRLAIHAVREFDKEVETGDREGLSREELMDETLSPALEAKGKKSTRGERVTAVIQSKILRQTDRVDPLTNLGKSKGFGFLEMRTHKDALKVLRWSNNNPEVGPLMREWAAAELDDLEKKTKEKLDKAREETAADLENMELNYKKLQAKVKDGVSGFVDQMKQGKTLLIEFSVENVQVVKRRVEKVGEARQGAAGGAPDRKRKTRANDDDSDNEEAANVKKEGRPSRDSKGKGKPRAKREDGDENSGDRPAKKRRTGGDKNGEASTSKEAPALTDAKDKAGKSMGGLIGKKRKERKAKSGK